MQVTAAVVAARGADFDCRRLELVEPGARPVPVMEQDA